MEGLCVWRTIIPIRINQLDLVQRHSVPKLIHLFHVAWHPYLIEKLLFGTVQPENDQPLLGTVRIQFLLPFAGESGPVNVVVEPSAFIAGLSIVLIDGERLAIIEARGGQRIVGCNGPEKCYRDVLGQVQFVLLVSHQEFAVGVLDVVGYFAPTFTMVAAIPGLVEYA